MDWVPKYGCHVHTGRGFYHLPENAHWCPRVATRSTLIARGAGTYAVRNALLRTSSQMPATVTGISFALKNGSSIPRKRNRALQVQHWQANELVIGRKSQASNIARKASSRP